MNPLQTTTLHLPPVLRAAVVRAYQDAFDLEHPAKKPRPLSFLQALRVRAAWICGTPDGHLAARHFKGRTDSLRELLSGESYTTATLAEMPQAAEQLATFYQAVEACQFAPVGAAAPGLLLPLEQFIRGEFKAAPAEAEEIEHEKPKEAPRPGGRLGFRVGLDDMRVTRRPQRLADVLAVGDEVRALCGQKVANVGEARQALEGRPVGELIEVGLVRDGEEFVVEVPLVSQEQEEQEAREKQDDLFS